MSGCVFLHESGKNKNKNKVEDEIDRQAGRGDTTLEKCGPSAKVGRGRSTPPPVLFFSILVLLSRVYSPSRSSLLMLVLLVV